MDNLEQKMVDALISWQLRGNRHVSIDIEEGKIKIWVYDYDITAGMYVSAIKEIPSPEYLKKLRRKNLEAELARFIQ